MDLPIETTRQRTHARSKPKHLDEFVVNYLLPLILRCLLDSGTSKSYPISQYVNYNKFSKSHCAFLAAITSIVEPKSFSQASKDPNWQEAMKREIHALESNGTWILTKLPPRKKAIESQWVYKIKFKPNGEVERYKACLVAKGYTQIKGVDFHETFASVAKLITIRCALAMAAKKQWEAHQLNVNNAFLHGELQEEVYMKVPQGFIKTEEDCVCKL